MKRAIFLILTLPIVMTGAILKVVFEFCAEIKKALVIKEIEEAFRILDEAGQKFDNSAFDQIRRRIEGSICSDKKKFIAIVQHERPIKNFIYSMIANASGDMLESGRYHVYRGVLNLAGNDLLQIFDFATEELARLGDTDAKTAEDQKQAIRKYIQCVG